MRVSHSVVKKSKELIFEIKGFLPDSVIVNVDEDLTITEDIDWEVDKAAARFGFYGVLCEKAATRVEQFKAKFDTWKANLRRSMDDELASEGKKKLTDAQMNSYILAHSKFLAYQQRLLELEEQYRIIKVLTRAFEKKADLIQTKAANRRREIK